MNTINFILELLTSLFSGMGIGFTAILKMFPLYQQLQDLKNQITAVGLGVPVAVISAAPIVIFIIKKLFKK